MLRHMYQKRYTMLKASTVKVQKLIRNRQAKRKLKHLREEKAAITIQKHWRRYTQQKKYTRARKAIYKLQISK